MSHVLLFSVKKWTAQLACISTAPTRLSLQCGQLASSADANRALPDPSVDTHFYRSKSHVYFLGVRKHAPAPLLGSRAESPGPPGGVRGPPGLKLEGKLSLGDTSKRLTSQAHYLVFGGPGAKNAFPVAFFGFFEA